MVIYLWTKLRELYPKHRNISVAETLAWDKTVTWENNGRSSKFTEPPRLLIRTAVSPYIALRDGDGKAA